MQNKKGSGLIFAVVLLFVILGMVITLSSVTVLETKMNQKTKSSVGAFYNADSGVEWALNKIATTASTDILGTFGTSAPGSGVKPVGVTDYNIYLLDKDGKVITTNLTIDQVKAVRAVGTQGGDTQRAIEAAVAAVGIGKHQLSCVALLASTTSSFNTCCRIDTETGNTSCKYDPAGGSPWFDWVYEKPGETW
jgi:hypothetical protein